MVLGQNTFRFPGLALYTSVCVLHAENLKKKICLENCYKNWGDVEVEIQYFTSYFTVFQIPFVKNISSIILLRIRVNNLYIFNMFFIFRLFTIEKLKFFFFKKNKIYVYVLHVWRLLDGLGTYIENSLKFMDELCPIK